MIVRWTRPLPRLMMVGALLVLLVLAFAYWWLGNGVHEILGTVFLLLVLRHVANNLFWWKGLQRQKLPPQHLFNLVLGVMLTIALIALLISSVLLSRFLALFLPIPRLFVMQEAHWFSAYWVIALAAMHTGVNWNKIQAFLRTISGKLAVQKWLKYVGWLLSLAISVQALSSGMVVGLWHRLAFQYSLSMWDFNEAILPFFLHWAAALIGLATLSQLCLLAVTHFMGAFGTK